MVESEFLISDDSYKRWCQIHALRRIYNIIRPHLKEDTSFQVNDPRFGLRPMRYSRKVVFLCGDEPGNYLPPWIDDVDLVVREVNHQPSVHHKIFPKPLPINARNTANGNTNKIDFHGNAGISMHLRLIDLFFAGQLHVQDRRDMMQAVKALPEETLGNSKFLLTQQFAGGVDMEHYSWMMSNSRIVLVPHGSAPETFRYAEAMLCGATVITTFCPRNLWYFRNSPAVVLNNWSELTSDLVESLLQDKLGLEDRKVAALTHYNKDLSDGAVAEYILNCL